MRSQIYIVHVTKAGGNHCAMFPLFKIEGAPHDPPPSTTPCPCSLCIARLKAAQ